MRKLVVASALTADGEPLHPVKWNNDFCGVPIVRKESQRRPTITESELTELLSRLPHRFMVLIATLAGTGLRIGEGLALKPRDFSPDFRVVNVTRSLWRGREQAPKTDAAIRAVDMPEPLAVLLRFYAAGKDANSFLFATRTGRPLGPRNVRRASGFGAHVFRRFRAEVLRRAGVPRDIERSWMGHAKETVGDFYAGGLQNDETRRRAWCERAGLGFTFGLYWARNETQLASQQAA